MSPEFKATKKSEVNINEVTLKDIYTTTFDISLF